MNNIARRLSFVLVPVLTMMLVAGCSSNDDGGFLDPSDQINGSGNIVSESRALPAFHSIDLRAVADVSITQSAAQDVVIETDDNIINRLHTTVSNGVLIIDTDVDYTTLHGVLIALDMTELQSVQLSGVGSVTAQNGFDTNDMALTLSGVGTITMAGTADTLAVTLSGVGDIDAEDVQAATCTVDLGGTGDCRVTVTDELTVTISGHGDVYYAGNPPVVNSNITGIGSLIQL